MDDRFWRTNVLGIRALTENLYGELFVLIEHTVHRSGSSRACDSRCIETR